MQKILYKHYLCNPTYLFKMINMKQKDKIQEMQEASNTLDPIVGPKYVFDMEAFNKEQELIKDQNVSGVNNQFNPSLREDLKVEKSNRYKNRDIDSTMYTPQELEAVAATNQSWGDAISNTGAGFYKQSKAGFLDFFAGNYDLKGMLNMAMGSPEAAAGNWLNDISKDIRDRAMEENPIFSTGDMTSKGYWLNQIQGLGYSAGLLVGGFADQVAMAALTGGAGNIATTGLKMGRTFSMARTAIQGFRSGMGEAYINGLHTAQEVREKALSEGLTPQQADEKAAEAATLAFRLEVLPLASLNALQYLTIFGKAGSPFTKLDAPGFGVSDALGSVGDKVIGSNKWAKRIFNMGSEAMEEVYQDGISNYAKGENFWQKDLIDSAIGGALGGILLPILGKGMSKSLEKLTGSSDGKELRDFRQNFINETINRHAEMFEERAKANIAYLKAEEALAKNNTPENQKALTQAAKDLEVANLNSQMINVMDSIRLDYGVKEGDTAFTNQIESMQAVYEAAKTNDIETLKSFGILDESGNEKYEGSIETILKEYPKNIENAQKIHALVTDNLENYSGDIDIAIKMAGHSFKVDSYLATKDANDSALATLKSQDPIYNRLSNEGKTLLDLEIELEAYQRIGNTEKVEEIKAKIKEEDLKYSEQDSIVSTISTNPMVNAKVASLTANQAAIEESEQIKFLKTKKGLDSLINGKIEDRIRNANTIESMEALESKFKAEKVDSKYLLKLQEKLSKAKEAKVASDLQAEIEAKRKADEAIAAQQAQQNVNTNTNTDNTQQSNTAQTSEPVQQAEQASQNMGTSAQQAAQQVLEDTPEAEVSEEDYNALFGEFTSSANSEFFSSGRNAPRRPELTDAVKASIKQRTDSIVQAIEDVLGREVTFADFVKNHGKKMGLADADKNFDLLQYSWEISGREVGDVDTVYKAIFKQEALLMDLFQPYLTGEQGVQEQETKAQEEITEQPVALGTDGRVIYEAVDLTLEDVSRTNNPNAKIAYQGHLYQEVTDPLTGQVSKKSIPQLNETLGNNFLLDPAHINEGSELTVVIPQGEQLDKSLVQVWSYDEASKRWSSESVEFGSLGYQPGTPEYIANVPMLLQDSNGNPLGYVHSPTWYNANNIQAKPGEDISENIIQGAQQALAIRNQVLEGNNKVVVTSKRVGSFYQVSKQVGDNNLIPISEATGETRLSVATNHESLSDSTGEEIRGKYEFINDFQKHPLRKGAVYDIRHVATTKNGTKQYLAILATPNSLSKGENLNSVAHNNVQGAVMAAFLLANRNQPAVVSTMESLYGITVTKAEAILKGIDNTTGVGPITDNTALYEYLRMFIPVFNSNSDFDAAMSNKFTESGVYAVLDNNIFKMYRKEKGTTPERKGAYLEIASINLNSGEKGVNNEVALQANITSIDNFFKSEGALIKGMPATVSKKQLGSNKPFASISEKGDVSVGNTYEDYIKGNFKTNIKSFPIKNEAGETVWVTDVQPMIYISSVTSANTAVDVNTIPPTQSVNTTVEEAFEKIDEASEINEDAFAQFTSSSQDTWGEGAFDMSTATSVETQVQTQEVVQEETFEALPISKTLENIPVELAETLKEILPGLADLGDMNFDSRRNFEQEGAVSIIEALFNLHTNRIEGINHLEQVKLIDSLFNAILAEVSLNGKAVDLNEVSGKISKSVDTYLQAQRDNYNNILAQIEASGYMDGNLQKIVNNIKLAIQKIDNVQEQKDKLISLGENGEGKGALVMEFEKFLAKDIKEFKENEEDVTQDDKGEQDRSYDESAFERNVQQSFSSALKVFFSGIPKRNKETGKEAKNLFGLTEYVSAQDAVQALREVIVDMPSSYKDIEAALEIKARTSSLHKALLEKFVNAPEKLQNEILYKLVQHQLDMYMIMYEKNSETGAVALKVYNANSTTPDIALKRAWKNNLQNSGLTHVVDETRVYDQNKLKAVLDKVQELSHNIKNDAITNEDALPIIKDVLNSLGIQLGESTLNYFVGTSQEGKPSGALKDKFSPSGFFGLLEKGLYPMTVLNANTIAELSVDKMNPFDNMQKQITELADLEIDLNGSRLSKAFRVSGKIIQGTIQNMMAYELASKIKDVNSELHQAMKSNAYTRGNYVLDAIEKDPLVAKKYGVDFVSLNAIKKDGSTSDDAKKVKDLSDFDGVLAQIAFFQNTTSQVNYALSESLRFRMTQMFNPALSDKEQMLLFNTPALKIGFYSFKPGGQGLNEETLNFVTEQIFTSELGRIIKSLQYSSNIKGYKDASRLFIAIPGINDVMIPSKDGSTEATLISQVEALYKQNSQESFDTILSRIKGELFEHARKAVEETIQTEVQNKIKFNIDGSIEGSWAELGLVESIEGSIITPHFDSKYLQSLGVGLNGVAYKGFTQKGLATVAAYDYVVNNILNQFNVYQMYAGDMALYGVNPKNYYTDGKLDSTAMAIAIGENITKRMAMLIAPGNKLANSKGDSYIQIMMNDPVDITSSARSYITQFYGEVTQEDEDNLQTIEKADRELYDMPSNTEDEVKAIKELKDAKDKAIKSLQKSYPSIANYFNIEGADAQEYTTWKEHLDILLRQGRLSSQERAKMTEIYNKLEQGEDLDQAEVDIVMNPIKPVYAGPHIDRRPSGEVELIRTVYVKSSSFPLLPQLTRDFKIDSVRQKMEALQEKKDKNVRLSFNTANKIGSSISNISIDDMYNKSFEELFQTSPEGVDTGLIADAMLTLDRDNFRIQQDTPYKTERYLAKNSEDYTTMGSQIWKIIMGGGIRQKGDIFPNTMGKVALDYLYKRVPPSMQELLKDISSKDMLSGEDLNTIKLAAENVLLNQLKSELYTELGLGKSGIAKDPNKVLRNLRDILISEVSTRNYPQNMLDSLELVEDILGQAEFVTPMWMSVNSDKIESLMQSIITSRLIQLKLPGNQLISASSEGFEKRTLEEIDSKTKEGIVWVNPEHKGALKATRFENGKLKEAEILVQSKFRVTTKDENGKETTKLIDLKDPKYSTMQGGFRVLNLEMFDEELLSSFSFRIPTSSHQSGAILKIVGFLPEGNADMLVVPKEQTVQLGEDYDIDKRTLYRSNYEVKEDGSIRKITPIREGSAQEKAQNRKQMMENIMIDIYKSVYLTEDTSVQNKISQVLSFDNAKETANLIDKRLKGKINSTGFTLLSDDYQRAQMKLGADGKIGIGVHSNSVTFQAMLEKLGAGEVEIRKPKASVLGKTIYVPSHITIGNINGKPLVSDGKLGNTSTLDGTRAIADVLTENQNSATDNIKEQIMGKRNENPYTMNVLVQLSMRGFDMVPVHNIPGESQIQISSLFISQPIIREYVKLMSETQSILAEYDPDAELDILTQLVAKYDTKTGKKRSTFVYREGTGNFEISMDEKTYADKSFAMTGDTLYDNLLEDVADPELQLAVLKTFLQLKSEAGQVNKVQKLLNLHSTGLGMSYFNTLRRDKVRKELFDGEIPIVGGAGALVGLSVPTSEGQMLNVSLEVANRVMPYLFPYDRGLIRETLNKVLENKKTTLSEGMETKMSYLVMKSLKQFINSGNNGLYVGNVNQERQRLLFDMNGNVSLASMMQRMSLSIDPKVNALFSTNPLLRGFDYSGINHKLNAEGHKIPSLLTQRPDQNDEYGKADKYSAFLELLQDDTTELGEFNGEMMTPRKLAQDIASYAFITDDNQATGIQEYIHMDYLKLIGVTENIRRNTRNLTSKETELFIRQFYQHNPDMAYQMSMTEATELKLLFSKGRLSGNYIPRASKIYEDLSVYQTAPRFISFPNGKYDKDTKKKGFDLYELTSQGVYMRLAPLGAKGYLEYNPSIQLQNSIMSSVSSTKGVREILEMKKLDSSDSMIEIPTFEELFNGDFTLENILRTIANRPGSKLSQLAKDIAPFMREGVKIEIADYKEDNKLGRYYPGSNTIVIDRDIARKLVEGNKLAEGENVLDVLEEVIMEEIIHSTTVDILAKYGDVTASEYNPVGEVPIFINRLAALYAEAKRLLPDNHYTKNMAEFVAGSLTVDSFKQELSQFKVADETIFDRFRKIIGNMIRYITGQSYDSVVAKEAMDLIKFRGVTQGINVAEQEVQDDNSELLNKVNSLMSYTPGGVLRPVLPSQMKVKDNEMIISGIKSFRPEKGKTMSQHFMNGSPVIISSSTDIINNSGEIQYVDALYEHIKNVIPEGTNINDVINTEILPDGKIKISPNKNLYEAVTSKGIEFASSQLGEDTLQEAILNSEISYENFLNEMSDLGIIEKKC